MDEDCLGLTLLDFEIALDKKYEDLFRRATAKDQKLHGLTKQYFASIRSKWKAYKEELCSDPTITTDLKLLQIKSSICVTFNKHNIIWSHWNVFDFLED